MRLLIKYFIFMLLFVQNTFAEEPVGRILSAISNLKKNPDDIISITSISGGLTNENYKVTVGTDNYFVRCGRSQNYLLGASLETEWQCSTLTSSVGLSPKTIKFYPEDRILVTEFLETKGGETDLKNVENMQKFCQLVRTLHRLPCRFPTNFSPFETIATYVKNAEEKEVLLPDVLVYEILPFIFEIQKNMEFSTELVPCHLDLHKRNVLNDGERLWLIDWEYAAMSDPLFDIAVVGSTDFFSDDEMDALLRVYLGRMPDSQESDHIYVMRILADARWALWCYLQDKISPLNAPFRMFGDLYIEQCLKRIARFACCPL